MSRIMNLHLNNRNGINLGSVDVSTAMQGGAIITSSQFNGYYKYLIALSHKHAQIIISERDQF